MSDELPEQPKINKKRVSKKLRRLEVMEFLRSQAKILGISNADLKEAIRTKFNFCERQARRYLQMLEIEIKEHSLKDEDLTIIRNEHKAFLLDQLKLACSKAYGNDDPRWAKAALDWYQQLIRLYPNELSVNELAKDLDKQITFNVVPFKKEESGGLNG
jgi:hypothetical protein